MSCSEAPPVARHGEPKKPCKNLSTMRPAMLSTKAVGMQRMTNMPKLTMYGGLRPIEGISLRGEKSSGPSPYARTYSERPNEVTSRLTPYICCRYGADGV